MSAPFAIVVAVSLMVDFVPRGDPEEYDTETRVTQARVAFIGGDMIQLQSEGLGGDHRRDFWEELGLCFQIGCEWMDSSRDCLNRMERGLPCVVNRGARPAPGSRDPDEPDRAWGDDPYTRMPLCDFNAPPPFTAADVKRCIPEGVLFNRLNKPEWTISDQPTPYWDGVWWYKLRL